MGPLCDRSFDKRCLADTAYQMGTQFPRELGPHMVSSVLGVGDFHPMPFTNVQLEISYAIAVVNGGIFNLTVKLLQILVQLVSRVALVLLVFKMLAKKDPGLSLFSFRA